ncbi:prepilin-type N-terminal cleavage/methylation domain-containing protein [uncultured Tateyamaria sp.]|uniref:prepilin-type N-terminal cleavage/methylation domain-containing protein n=1 Tax=uncultured Tateyamaria sp. TaxID=455651 RepID=UPI00262077E9|nr:prepilin-type N-terminal cleavage/methylation domain-containing protein [uncultured Tateyamaria sp.]
MTQHRACHAGVSLVEMLVVLALFAIVASAVALSLPQSQRSTSDEAAARAFVAQLDRAIDQALVTGTGFGVLHDGEAIRFVQRGSDAEWVAHSDKHLARAKLSASTSRISINAKEVYAVSARLIPSSATPFRAEFGRGAGRQIVFFDGARVRLQDQP